MKEALYTLGSLVHNLQKERGCASMFLCSEGKLFKKRMYRQFVDSDATLKSFDEDLECWKQSNRLKSTQLEKLQSLLDLYKELPDFREKIFAQDLSISALIDHYAHHLISPLLQVMVEIALYMEECKPVFVSTYNAFLQWKERIGLERAISARGFINHTFHNSEFLERVLSLLSSQNNYCNTYLALANEPQKQLVQKIMESKECAELERLHDELKKSPESQELYDIIPEMWFDLITAKIDALHLIENKLIDALDEENKPDDSHAIKSDNNTLNGYNNFIRNLPLFLGISSENLNSLLYHGQIREFHKGKLLFLEGEQANRLYIILKGWVKIFKGTAAGEETILQMLSSGDSIMESAIFLNTSFPVSAQIAEDATVLSLPAPVLREQVKSNHDLALNLLSSMSYRSQGLIRQIEYARLKSVDERTGWFLLRLLLEQGYISQSVELPYDKSLIASYLDMKRETFSRSLKRLKAKGFNIRNNTIVIPDLGALCGFCDSDTAQLCSLHDTSDCHNPDCTATNECEG